MTMERTTQQAGRPWRRLHFSTWLLLTLPLGALVVANLRGEKSPLDFYEAIDREEDVCWHGWPAAFLRRQLHSLDGIADIDAWAITEHVMEVDPVALLADLMAGALLLTVAASVFEWRRRRRGRFCQFTLAEWLTAISMLAVSLASWKQRQLAILHLESTAHEWLAREEELGTNRDLELHWEPNLPVWIRNTIRDEVLNQFGYSNLTLRADRSVPAEDDVLSHALIQSVLEQNPSTRLRLKDNDSAANLRRFPLLERLALDEGVDIARVPFDSLSNLRGLRLCYNWWSSDDPSQPAPSGGAQLAQLSKLEYFRGKREQIGDEGIEALASLRRLTTLHLRGVTDKDMLRLSALANLRVLVLPASQLTDEGWAAIAKLTRLEQLIVRGGDFGDAALVHIQGLSRLRGLDLHNSNVSDAGLSAIGHCTALEELNLGGCDITGCGLAELAPLQNLNSLDLSDCPLRDAEFLYLPKFPRLEYLYLSRTRLTGSGLAVVNGCERLRRLEMYSSRVRSLRELNLSTLPALEVIWAGDNVSDDEAAQLMAGRPDLYVSVDRFRQTDASFRSRLAAIQKGRKSEMSVLFGPSIDARLAELRDLPALEELSIHGGSLEDRHLGAVAQIPGLKVLRLYATSVTLQGLRHLEKLSNLRHLALGQAHVSDRGLRQLPCLHALKALALDEAQLDEQVVERLKQFPSLRKLLVSGWRHHCVRRKDSLAWLEELRRQLPCVEVIALIPLDLEETQTFRR